MIVKIANPKESFEVEAVEVHGVWAVTPVIGASLSGRYCVTHAPTGLAIRTSIPLRHASELARVLAEHWPKWEAGHATVSDPKNAPVPPPGMGQIVRDWRPTAPTRAEMVEDLMSAVENGLHARARELVAAIRAVSQ